MLGVLRRRWKTKRTNGNGRKQRDKGGPGDSHVTEVESVAKSSHQVHPAQEKMLDKMNINGLVVVVAQPPPPSSSPTSQSPQGTPRSPVKERAVSVMERVRGSFRTSPKSSTSCSSSSAAACNARRSDPTTTTTTSSSAAGVCPSSRTLLPPPPPPLPPPRTSEASCSLASRSSSLITQVAVAAEKCDSSKEKVDDSNGAVKFWNNREDNWLSKCDQQLKEELENERSCRNNLEVKLKDLSDDRDHCKAHIVTLQEEHKKMEGLIQNLMQYKAMHEQVKQEKSVLGLAYENKLRNCHVSIARLEKVNLMLVNEMKNMADPHSEGRDSALNRSLLERLKCLEAENSSLAMENDEQRIQYEKCLDDVANQVVQALLSQKGLQEECQKLRKQVAELDQQNKALHLLFQQRFQRNVETFPKERHSDDNKAKGRNSSNSSTDGSHRGRPIPQTRGRPSKRCSSLNAKAEVSESCVQSQTAAEDMSMISNSEDSNESLISMCSDCSLPSSATNCSGSWDHCSPSSYRDLTATADCLEGCSGEGPAPAKGNQTRSLGTNGFSVPTTSPSSSSSSSPSSRSPSSPSPSSSSSSAAEGISSHRAPYSSSCTGTGRSNGPLMGTSDLLRLNSRKVGTRKPHLGQGSSVPLSHAQDLILGHLDSMDTPTEDMVILDYLNVVNGAQVSQVFAEKLTPLSRPQSLPVGCKKYSATVERASRTEQREKLPSLDALTSTVNLCRTVHGVLPDFGWRLKAALGTKGVTESLESSPKDAETSASPVVACKPVGEDKMTADTSSVMVGSKDEGYSTMSSDVQCDGDQPEGAVSRRQSTALSPDFLGYEDGSPSSPSSENSSSASTASSTDEKETPNNDDTGVWGSPVKDMGTGAVRKTARLWEKTCSSSPKSLCLFEERSSSLVALDKGHVRNVRLHFETIGGSGTGVGTLCLKTDTEEDEDDEFFVPIFTPVSFGPERTRRICLSEGSIDGISSIEDGLRNPEFRVSEPELRTRREEQRPRASALVRSKARLSLTEQLPLRRVAIDTATDSTSERSLVSEVPATYSLDWSPDDVMCDPSSDLDTLSSEGDVLDQWSLSYEERNVLGFEGGYEQISTCYNDDEICNWSLNFSNENMSADDTGSGSSWSGSRKNMGPSSTNRRRSSGSLPSIMESEDEDPAAERLGLTPRCRWKSKDIERRISRGRVIELRKNGAFNSWPLPTAANCSIALPDPRCSGQPQRVCDNSATDILWASFPVLMQLQSEVDLVRVSGTSLGHLAEEDLEPFTLGTNFRQDFYQLCAVESCRSLDKEEALTCGSNQAEVGAENKCEDEEEDSDPKEGCHTSWVLFEADVDLSDPKARANLLDSMVASSSDASSTSNSNSSSCSGSGSESTYDDYDNEHEHRERLQELHRVRRQKRASDRQRGVRYIPVVRPSILDRKGLFYRYGEKEQEAVSSFDFLEDLSTSISDVGSMEAIQHSKQGTSSSSEILERLSLSDSCAEAYASSTNSLKSLEV